MFISKTDIRIAEPIDAQMDELGNDIIQMYQPIGVITDEKASGLESILNYMNENLVSKDEPYINEHHYHIIKKTIQRRNTQHIQHI